MFSQSVTIGPEFFVKSFNDYRDKYWAFVREILQNSLDCGSTKIEISVVEMPDAERGDLTLVVVRNNGEVMTREILVDKLLSLGSSGKDFQGAVGGFGKAKEILYFAHQSYVIHSGEWLVSGSGAGYNIEPADTFVGGTESAVTWKGPVGSNLRRNFRRFIELCDRKGCEFTLDGDPVKRMIPRFQVDRPMVHEGEEWAQLGVAKFEPQLLLVRIAGLPMFWERSDHRRTLILELQGASGERLTANRDTRRWPYSGQLTDLITKMAIDPHTSLKLEEPVYTRCAGPRLNVPAPEKPAAAAPPLDPGDAVVVAALVAPPRNAPNCGGGIRVDVQGRNEAPVSVLAHEFILKNCVRRAIPREFNPHALEFSDHAHWLARAWVGCLVELHAICGNTEPFSVGFVFSDLVEAESETSAAYGQVYFLNPCRIGKKSTSRRFKQSNRGQIASDAAHEFVHGGLGCSYHGEDFAARFTDLTGLMINHWRRFARHFT